MKPNRAVAVSVGLLVWGWTFVSLGYLEPRVITWVTFLTWASFFAAGGGPAGLGKSIASGLFGVLASAAVIWLDSHLNAGAYHLVVLSLLLGLLGALLCVVAALPLLSCIPASFIGASAFFAADSPLDGKLLSVLGSVVVGAFLGFISQRLAGALTTPTADALATHGAQEPAGAGRG